MNKTTTKKIGKMAEKALKEAVKEAIDKHAKMGIPAVFMKNGKIVYRLPDGTIVNKVAKSFKNRKNEATT